MATVVRTIETESRIRVAVVIEAGRIRPVWFEEIGNPGRDRIFIKQVCQVCTHQEGDTRIISFSVWDGSNSFVLLLNCREFSWRLRVVEEKVLPDRFRCK